MITVTAATDTTITVLVPIKVHRGQGRRRVAIAYDGCPKADETQTAKPDNTAVIRAIARAWDWRRRLESGEAATIQDLAAADGVSVPYISKFIRLAYLAPTLLHSIVVETTCEESSACELAAAALTTWVEQQRLDRE